MKVRKRMPSPDLELNKAIGRLVAATREVSESETVDSTINRLTISIEAEAIDDVEDLVNHTIVGVINYLMTSKEKSTNDKKLSSRKSRKKRR